MVINDEWLQQNREKRDLLLEKHGMKPKEYELLEYDSTGVLVRYQEKDGPVKVRRDNLWVDEDSLKTKPVGKRTRTTITDSLKKLIITRIRRKYEPTAIANEFGISAATVAKIKKELEK